MNQGKCKRLALFLLPCTTSVLADAIQRELLDITSKSAVNRNYQALLPLEAKGVVVEGGLDGCLWRVSREEKNALSAIKSVYSATERR
jgi:hypothetical protein